MVFTLLGMTIEEIPAQPSKAELPIEVTEFPITMSVKPLHTWKALLPMDVTELGISMLVKQLQPEKALSPIEVIKPPKTTSFNLFLQY